MAVLEKFSFVGEVSFLKHDSTAASATCTTTKETPLYSWSLDDVSELLQRNPALERRIVYLLQREVMKKLANAPREDDGLDEDFGAEAPTGSGSGVATSNVAGLKDTITRSEKIAVSQAYQKAASPHGSSAIGGGGTQETLQGEGQTTAEQWSQKLDETMQENCSVM